MSTIPEEERKLCVLYEDAAWVPETFDPKNDHKWIRDAFFDHFWKMHELGLSLLGHIAEGLGKNCDLFLPWFKEACSSTSGQV